jgi:ribosomal protein L44E
MAKHYNRWTVGDTVFCKTCKGFTLHVVSQGRLGHCVPCFDKRQQKEAERKAHEAANPVFTFAEALR